MIHDPRISIIALETLAIYIRGSDEIKGINIRNEHEIKLIAFADMTTFLKDYQSAEKLLHVLNDFGRCSGLKLNESKLLLLSQQLHRFQHGTNWRSDI